MADEIDTPAVAGRRSLLHLLPESAIVVGAHVGDWREAIGVAGGLLTASGAATPGYLDEMIQTVEEYGPYIVIAPGLALAHARPSPAVLRTGLSWARLAAPVAFGSPANDPVDVVIGLAAVDRDAHSAGLARLARMLADPCRFGALKAASTPGEVRRLIAGHEEGGA